MHGDDDDWGEQPVYRGSTGRKHWEASREEALGGSTQLAAHRDARMGPLKARLEHHVHLGVMSLRKAVEDIHGLLGPFASSSDQASLFPFKRVRAPSKFYKIQRTWMAPVRLPTASRNKFKK